MLQLPVDRADWEGNQTEKATMREAPELMIEIGERTVIALDRECDWPDIEVHRRCIEARKRRRLATRDSLLGRIDDVLARSA